MRYDADAEPTKQEPDTDSRERIERGRAKLIEALQTMTAEEATRLLGSEEDRLAALALFELAGNPPPDVDDADDAEDLISPLQSLSDTLANLDLELENNAAVIPPFVGLPSAQTIGKFIDALLLTDERAANAIVQQHCDAAFATVLKTHQRTQKPLKPGESPRELSQRAAHHARVSVVHGALFYARFFAAVATTLANAELHIADEAAEGNTRAKA